MKTPARRVLASLSTAATLAFTFAGLTACATDEPAGHTQTTTKSTTNTPNGKTTVTETHEKDTKVYPK